MIRTMYAHKTERGWRDIYSSAGAVQMCDGKEPQPIYQIKVTVDPKGEYFGWHDFSNDSLSMIWQSRVQLEMCFTYGIEAAIKRGKGKDVLLKIEEIDIVKPAEKG